MRDETKDPRKKGLRAVVQDRLVNDVFRKSNSKWPGWMVLILDPESLRVISSALGMYDLMEERVSIVEDLHKKRAPFRDMAALYLLAPTEESVSRLIADWEKKDPMYGKVVFLYFLGRLSDRLVNRIKGCKELVKRIRVFSEVNLDFLAKEVRFFHLDMNSCFAELYRKELGDEPKVAELVIGDKLVSLCATLNEYPHIRYKQTSKTCKSIANIFHAKINEFVGGNESWWYHGDANHAERGRATLLLLDRSDDCLSPFMHEFTYQAMVNDLLPIDDDRITYMAEASGTSADTGDAEATIPQDVLLNENDELWVELRGRHIADVVQTLSTRIRDMVKSNTTNVINTKGNDASALSLSQMASALKALPEYREVMSKLSQHMHISHQCMDIFNKQRLLDLSELEQTLATGKTEAGRVPKLNDLITHVEEELGDIEDSIVRLRLLAILVVSQNGIRESDSEKLLAAARLTNEEITTLNNLEKLGLNVIQEGGRTNRVRGILGGPKAASRGREDTESEYSSSRYVCNLKTTLEEIRENKLSFEDYPSVLPMPEETGGSTGGGGGGGGGNVYSARPKKMVGSARRNQEKKSKWSKVEQKKPGFHGARQIVFMVGGMCYSEMRSVTEVMADGEKEFIAGSTRFIAPDDFVQDVKSLT